ncbi:MAG: 30S ribosomal protein S19e [Candidatus Hodarchaeota archaeon]
MAQTVPPVTNVYVVEADEFIEKMAEKIRNFPEINCPLDMKFWKTSAAREFPPDNPEDFWYIRCASLLRKLAINKIVGVNRLRKIYGSIQRKGVKPNHSRRAAGGIIRRCLQQLQKAGLVEIVEKEGRKLTPAGQSLVDKVAHEIIRSRSSN